ncbi:glycosyltransferase [Candidatus Sumerlaeota bacterium]|nr:glycosyltransferase [Candidatus Sumerlaeota bacterium]
MTIKEKVSIITPVYNCEKYIEETIRSVQEQTFVNWEWIICDDGSTDKTIDIIRERIRSDKRIRLISQEHSGLPAKGRNGALSLRSGDFIAFLDSDDKWHPEKLAIQTQYLKEHPGCHAVNALYELIGDPETVKFHSGIQEQSYHEKADFDAMFLKCLVHISSLMIRNSLINEVGIFDEDPGLRGVEDYDYLLRLTYRRPIHQISRTLSCYRIAMGTVLHDKEYNRFEKEMRLLEKMVTSGYERDNRRIRKRKAAIYYNRGINALYLYGGAFRKDFMQSFILDKTDPKILITLCSSWLPASLLRKWLKLLLSMKKKIKTRTSSKG